METERLLLSERRRGRETRSRNGADLETGAENLRGPGAGSMPVCRVGRQGQCHLILYRRQISDRQTGQADDGSFARLLRRAGQRYRRVSVALRTFVFCLFLRVDSSIL